jgi:hypothetical protein
VKAGKISFNSVCSGVVWTMSGETSMFQHDVVTEHAATDGRVVLRRQGGEEEDLTILQMSC